MKIELNIRFIYFICIYITDKLNTFQENLINILKYI